MRIRESFYTTGYMPFDIEKMLNQMVEDAQRMLLEKEKSWKKQGLEVTSVLIEKEEGLDKSIKTKYFAKADLVIMGTHGRNKVLTSFLGSRARKLILESPVPVVVVRNKTG
ncbi:Universal stress protein family protein [compost metagenome]